MNELVKVQTTERGEQRVSARELHKNLESKKRFSDWWKQWGAKYVQNIDYFAGHSEVTTNQYGSTKPMIDYFLTVNTAKNIAMLTDTQRGDEIRDYFIKVEEAFNSPEMMMARAVKYADSQLLGYQEQVRMLEADNATMRPKVDVYDHFIATGEDLNLRDAAGEIGMRQNDFINALLRDRYLYFKTGSSNKRKYKAYAQYLNQGGKSLFVYKAAYDNYDPQILVTPLGRKKFYEKYVVGKQIELGV